LPKKNETTFDIREKNQTIIVDAKVNAAIKG